MGSSTRLTLDLNDSVESAVGPGGLTMADLDRLRKRFAPIVKAQKTPDQWSAFLQPHRIKVPDMADADFTEVGKFLKAHYNPQNPVPKLPPELDKLGLPPA